MPVVTTLSGELVSVDLSTRDFEGFRSDVLSSGGLADLYTPDWSDRSSFDLGVALVEAMAFMCDNLSYYQDRMANEALFPSAVQRRSVIEHCKLLGYELRAAVSAAVELSITSNALASASEVPGVNDSLGRAPASFTVNTTDGSRTVRYELLETLSFTGIETKTAYAYEGTTYSEVLGSSNGTSSQRFNLLRKPLALNPDGTSSLKVSVITVGTPVEWTQVDNFLLSGPTDTHYRVEIDENDLVTVIFGDGVNGSIPASGSSNLLVTYRVGNGHLGNEVGPGKITKIDGSYPFLGAITNAVAPSGGMDKETIEEAKENAPKTLRAMQRCVTHDDYTAIALTVPGVRHAFASRGKGAYEERIVVATSGQNPVPTGSWDPYHPELRDGLLGAVGAKLDMWKTTPVILTVEPVRVIGAYLAVNVFCTSSVRASSVKRQVEDAIYALFNPDNETLGQQFPLSKVYETLEGIVGVQYADVVQLQRHPNPRQLQGGDTDVAIGNFVVGANTIDEVYTLSFTSDTTYDVYGYKSGYKGSGVVGSSFVTSSNELRFTVTGGSIAPSNACKFEIVTSAYISNINPAYDELVVLQNGTFQLTTNGGLS